jgi:hypothetical protein
VVRECLIGVKNPKINTTSEENTAAEVLTALFDAEKMGQGDKTVQDIVGELRMDREHYSQCPQGLANALSEGI